MTAEISPEIGGWESESHGFLDFKLGLRRSLYAYDRLSLNHVGRVRYEVLVEVTGCLDTRYLVLMQNSGFDHGHKLVDHKTTYIIQKKP